MPGSLRNENPKGDESETEKSVDTPKSGSGALRPQSTPASTAGGDDDYVGVP